MAGSDGKLACLLLVVLTLLCSQIMGRQVQKSLQKGNSKVLRSDLIHKDHPNSPLSTNKTIFERSAAAWESSKARSHRVTTPNPGLTGFQTPVKQSDDLTEYVMRISVGTPAQHFIAIVDTGSDLVWLQCNCIDCNEQPDPIFRSGNSTSYSPVSCGDPYCVPKNFPTAVHCFFDGSCFYEYSYADTESTAGQVALETLTLTELTGGSTFPVENFVFGCGWIQNGSFAGVDGLIGLGRGPLSLPSQVSTLYSKVFGYCLVNFGLQTNKTSPLLFGSFDASAIIGHTLTQTRLLQNPVYSSFYYVPLTAVTVNGVDLGIPASNFALNSTTYEDGVIFDSGTPITRLDNATIDAIVQSLRSTYKFPEASQDNSSTVFPLCYNITWNAEEFSTMKMAFQFSGTKGHSVVDFPLSVENMFLPVDDNVVCLAMLAVDSPPYIIGSIAQTNHFIEYDEGHKRLRWTQMDCTTM